MAGHGSHKALPEWLHNRQTKGTEVSEDFAGCCSMTPDLVRRLGLVKELEGHTGCVNCIQWNSNGRLLASGSDDKTVIVWDGLVGRRMARVETPHEGNIFSVVWMPGADDQLVGTGAGDCRVCILNVETGATVKSVSGHQGRVKRLTTAPDSPGVVWSGGEDGIVRQWDLRERWSIDSSNVLVNLTHHAGRGAEVKCVSICPGRSELIAVGANDPFVRVFDRRMITCSRLDPSALPDTESGAVAYFVPGHLPGVEAAFHRKLRPLTSTYITYNKDGTELLCNLGGEQIYLYDKFAMYSTSAPINLAVIQNCDKSQLPANGFSNIGLKNGQSRTAFKNLPSDVEALKLQANSEFEAQDFSKAVYLYNQAISLHQTPHPILCGNRAAALMKRKWDGDIYAAFRDCLSALFLDPGHIKAHLRLAQCLTELDWLPEATKCLDNFKLKHPEHKKSAAFTQREIDLNAALEKKSATSNRTGAAASSVAPPPASSPELSRYSAASFLRSDDQVEAMDSDDDSDDEAVRPPSSPILHPGGISSRLGNISSEHSKQEIEFRLKARDYSARFLGACNTTTDIKEANFLGRNGQFIMAGSDDGKFFIWDRKTTNIVKVLVGDEAIVNCLQGHPTAPILATSGIDPVVRIWQPRPEDGQENTRAVGDLEAAASSNQRRMNADPFETILMNMGYRMNVDEEPGDANEGAVQCRPS
eukprot:TRINITY_DN6817_c0_g1_i1.p1 TRINITY_DN6817_c0_g1~~TRINITY_DN6817_c0_g1_i1.p1  ORF type:complete len:702 (-),score=218.04 TRINITY_DN6817_c0_g1_i1:138-2243(-)